jgi:hypothetical protein
VERLKAQCFKYLEKKISRSTCVSFIKQAIDYKMEEVQERCLTMLAKSFYCLHESDLSFLPLDVILNLCKFFFFFIVDRFVLFCFVLFCFVLFCFVFNGFCLFICFCFVCFCFLKEIIKKYVYKKKKKN